MLYSSRSDYLRRHLREVPLFRALIRSIECRLFEEAGPLPQPVLDVGCGDGHFAVCAFANPVDVGIDLQWNKVTEARAAGGHRMLLIASSEALPFRRESFSTVIANCVLEHVEKVDLALKEISRVLQPRGRFLFGVPSPFFDEFLFFSTLARRLGLRRLAGSYGKWFHRHSEHLHIDGEAVWRERLERCAFLVKASRYYMSHDSHRWFDLFHYLSVPNLVFKKLFGTWVLFPDLLPSFYEARLRPRCEQDPAGSGAYLFFDCERRSVPGASVK